MHLFICVCASITYTHMSTHTHIFVQKDIHLWAPSASQSLQSSQGRGALFPRAAWKTNFLQSPNPKPIFLEAYGQFKSGSTVPQIQGRDMHGYPASNRNLVSRCCPWPFQFELRTSPESMLFGAAEPDNVMPPAGSDQPCIEAYCLRGNEFHW